MEKVLYCLQIKIKTKTQIKIKIQKPNQNLNKNPNQIPDQNLPPNQNHMPPCNAYMPNAPLVTEAPQRPQLNWSLLIQNMQGRPDKDVEAHLLRTNDWMDTHEFLEHVEVQRFCLTLVGEARLCTNHLDQ